jgi:long-subunit acyl-CoA synthetase (AMP-forming)
MELYGQTETGGGIIAGQRGRFPRPGTVGTMPPGWEVKLSEDEPNRGEILVRSADLFDGYWGNPAATREIKGDDGWLRTGDIGEWVEVGADHHPAASGGTPPQRGGEKDCAPTAPLSAARRARGR